ncbi:hypothetical protein ACE400_29585, partial [Salmonella enterica]|uniref:hypothetical protein n=1 Tax=Salmonella enterica TaxID=28901 RepID=UPI003D26B654
APLSSEVEIKREEGDADDNGEDEEEAVEEVDGSEDDRSPEKEKKKERIEPEDDLVKEEEVAAPAITQRVTRNSLSSNSKTNTKTEAS